MIAKTKEKTAKVRVRKAKAEAKGEELYRREAERLGITFNGFLKWPDKNKPPLPMFTDTVRTRSSFTIVECESTEAALARVRERFYTATSEHDIKR